MDFFDWKFVDFSLEFGDFFKFDLNNLKNL